MANQLNKKTPAPKKLKPQDSGCKLIRNTASRQFLKKKVVVKL